jgi:hypothetical protein
VDAAGRSPPMDAGETPPEHASGRIETVSGHSNTANRAYSLI